jgi:hypothetical protein
MTALTLGAPLGGFGILAVFVVGVFFFVRWRRHSHRVRWVGVALSALVVIFVIWQSVIDANLEWNPSISDDSQVVGTWTGRGQGITLSPDHTFIRQIDSQTGRGTWRRDDWNLYLEGASLPMRFVQFRGQYRLLINPPGDPDNWDGDLGLRLQQHQ